VIESTPEVSESIEPFDFAEFEAAASASEEPIDESGALEAADMSDFDVLAAAIDSPTTEVETPGMIDGSEPATDALPAEPAEAVDVPVDLTSWSNVEEHAADADAVSAQPVHAVEIAASDGVRLTIEHLGVDVGLFGRVRAAKALMIEAGQIQGDQLLPGVEPPGPTLQDLEHMAAENPEDVATRRRFAGALVEAEDGGRALAEYHAMFTSRMPFEEDDLDKLSRVVEHDEYAVSGNRLLGAIYRQAGNFGLSANRYRQSLVAHRDNARKEA
jgi:hypothetical protein